MFRYFDRDFMLYKLWESNDIIEETIVDTSRWSVHYEIIFQHEGKFYRAYYSEGATECQDESPWEYEDKVKCEEVKQVEKMVKVWEPVEAVEK